MLIVPTQKIDELVRVWLMSDVPTFDIGGFVVGEEVREAEILGKAPGIFAGRIFADRLVLFAGRGEVKIEWFVKDGDVISTENAKMKKPVARLRGPANLLLLMERTLLNIVSRASGIATLSRRYVEIARSANWKGEIAATRKTTPGFHLLEKYACLVGGASTHRLDLSQMVMLKDNHVWAVGSIRAAVKKARSVGGFSIKIEVEARDFEEAVEAAESGADIVMLDNMTPAQIGVESEKLKRRFPNVVIEASGGIDESTLASYLKPHVDVVSVGKLTQGYPCLDFSMKVVRGNRTAKL